MRRYGRPTRMVRVRGAPLGVVTALVRVTAPSPAAVFAVVERIARPLPLVVAVARVTPVSVR